MNKGYLIDGSIRFEPANYKITVNDKEVRLSQKECQVLEILCANCNIVVERHLFIESIWGNSSSGDIGLNKAILLLRRKFESHDLTNLINTIPRVGYTLNASITDLSYAEENSYAPPLAEKNTTDKHPSYNKIIKHDGADRKKRICKVIFTAVIAILFASIGSIMLSDSNNGPVITSIHQTGLSITYTSSIKYDKPLLTRTNKYLSKENKYYFRALLSTEILSVILYENKFPVNEKVFTINQARDIEEQVTCIDSYLSKNINTSEEPSNNLISGMMYSSKELYSFCKNNTVSKLGTLYTKGTKLAHGSDKDHMMLQDFLLMAPTGKVVFHIKLYIHHLGYGTEHMNFVQKSVMSEKIDMDLIHTNKLYSGLLSELTQDDVMHTQLEPQLYISEIFGGMLFYTKNHH
ncbi:winged helix-turn-helix domain-containing protein [Aeromonas sp. 600584]|uniref:winged helix-turn-helix domain-containing protein n=1 Tax=Aeromonas sp. 600584 TaxID=2712030 RepID=UPI003B9FCC46